ncbi:MAG: hypothetical protein WBF04_18115 [Candidatus Sulfotelmatobacter sp.]
MTTLTTSTEIEQHQVVSPQQWIASRKEAPPQRKRIHQAAR